MYHKYYITLILKYLFPLFQWHACRLAKLSAFIAKCTDYYNKIYIFFYAILTKTFIIFKFSLTQKLRSYGFSANITWIMPIQWNSVFKNRLKFVTNKRVHLFYDEKKVKPLWIHCLQMYCFYSEQLQFSFYLAISREISYFEAKQIQKITLNIPLFLRCVIVK